MRIILIRIENDNQNQSPLQVFFVFDVKSAFHSLKSEAESIFTAFNGS